MSQTTASIAREISATMDWWHASGIDCSFEDDATVWLKPVVDTKSSAPASAEANIDRAAPADREPRDNAGAENLANQPDLLGQDPPQSLDSFRDFWLNAPGLDPIGPRGRVPPRGPAKAELMVLVADPEQADQSHLLSGVQGRFVSAMLAAMGLSEEQVYFASALTRHTPMADTQAIARTGMRAVLRHHIALAAPQRAIAFGGNILPLLGHEPPNDGKTLPEINPIASDTPFLKSEGLDSLIASPRLKARFWRRWIEWRAEH